MVNLCTAGLTRWATKALLLLFTLFLILKLMEMTTHSRTAQLTEKSSTEHPSIKCHLSKPCPKFHFAFMVTSGMANVVGPKICLEDNILMSGVKNNVEKGLNIALVNGRTGALIKTASFNTNDGTKNRLIPFLKSISEDSIVMMTNYDDFSTKLSSEARNLIVNLGSCNITKLGFRDNWVFVGHKGMRNSPFELIIKRKVDGSWPDTLEMGGCIPRRGRDNPAT